MSNDDWTKHNGGECPQEVVEAGRSRKCVILKFRDFGTEPTYSPGLWRWVHTRRLDDIVAYRIIEASQPSCSAGRVTEDSLVSLGFKRVAKGVMQSWDKTIDDYEGAFGFARSVLRLIILADETDVELISFREDGEEENGVGLTKVHPKTIDQLKELIRVLGGTF